MNLAFQVGANFKTFLRTLALTSDSALISVMCKLIGRASI